MLKNNLFLVIVLISFFVRGQEQKNSIQQLLKFPNDSNKVMELIKIGTKLIQNGKVDSAKLVYLKTIEIAKKINYRFGELNIELDLAGIEMKDGNYEKSLNSYLSILKNAKIENIKSIQAKAYNGIGTIYFEQGKINEAIDCFIKSSLIYEVLNEKSRLGASYINIGAMYSELKNDALAYKYYFKAIDVFKQTGNEDYIIAAWHNIGIIHQDRKAFDSANYYYDKALQLSKKLNNVNQMALSYNYLGSILSEKKEFEKAVNAFNSALNLINQMGDINWRARILLELTDVYLQNKNADKVIETIKEVEFINLKIGSLSIKRDCNRQLWHAYRLKGQHLLADEYANTFVKINDSLLNTENIDKLAELNAKYENDKSQKQIEIKNSQLKTQLAEIEKSAFQRNAFIVGSAFLLIVLVLMIRGYLLIVKRNNKISTQNELIQNQHKILEQKQKEIIDSINYAQRIQKAHLPTDKFIAKHISKKRG